MQYYESSAWGKWCRRVYGIDLKQMGTVTKDELELFYREVELSPGSHILDMGCGPGYISAAVAEQFNSRVIGIDNDEGAINHAQKTFSKNPLLRFQLADGNNVSFEASTFDLICFFDTLYFTGSIEKLRALLDKCFAMLKQNGKMAVFWSNYPNKLYNIFEMSVPAAGSTQVGIWSADNNIPVKTFDLTESIGEFWQKAQEATLMMESELLHEIPERYDQVMDESSRFLKLFAEGSLFRWLYIFSKQ